MAKTLVYQLYPLTWGSFDKMIRHLPRIEALDADYIWLSPIYPSPFRDHGYDVANYTAISPAFGTMGDFDKFVKEANDRGIKVLMDLVLNHTSTSHPWFRQKPEYYIWEPPKKHNHSDIFPRSGWHNLFDGYSAWEYDSKIGAFYLHLFHPEQADLNWFPDGQNINQPLVREYQQIVNFWVREHGVSGFRLDVPQGINKDLEADSMELSDLLDGDKSIEVINAIFPGPNSPFLMMECFDPTFGKITRKYTQNTPIDFVLNALLKNQISQGEANFLGLIEQQSSDPHFMLDLESHDSPRFPSRNKATPKGMFLYMFGSSAEGICLYQGQELGLSNPTRKQLSDKRMLQLDAQTAMRHARGEQLGSLRSDSRANARVPLSMKEYKSQEIYHDSCLNMTKTWIELWRES